MYDQIETDIVFDCPNCGNKVETCLTSKVITSEAMTVGRATATVGCQCGCGAKMEATQHPSRCIMRGEDGKERGHARQESIG